MILLDILSRTGSVSARNTWTGIGSALTGTVEGACCVEAPATRDRQVKLVHLLRSSTLVECNIVLAQKLLPVWI